MSNKYNDPYSRDAIITIVEKLKDHDEIKQFIESTFPGWLVSKTDKYCSDYPHLTKNWLHICNHLNVKPQCIVLVDHIPVETENVQILHTFSEIMTKAGYVVRRKTEFQFCPTCGAAIPTEGLYEALINMKNIPGAENPLKNAIFPDKWSERCIGC